MNADGHLWWYVARSSGIVAWAALAAAVVWGVLIAGRLVPARGSARWLTAVHRHLGGTALVLTALHLLGLLLDGWLGYGPADLFVPFASAYRPGPVAWGVAAFYVLVAVEVTSLLQRRLSRRTWRGVHLTSYLMFWMVTLHGATAGTDTSAAWYRVAAVGVVLLTVYVLVARLLVRPPGGRRERANARVRPAAVR